MTTPTVMPTLEQWTRFVEAFLDSRQDGFLDEELAEAIMERIDRSLKTTADGESA